MVVGPAPPPLYSWSTAPPRRPSNPPKRRFAGPPRVDRGTSEGDGGAGPRIYRAYQGRQAAPAGGADDAALGGAAEHPNRGRVRALLRGKRMERRGCAKEYARRNRRQAQ